MNGWIIVGGVAAAIALAGWMIAAHGARTSRELSNRLGEQNRAYSRILRHMIFRDEPCPGYSCSLTQMGHLLDGLPDGDLLRVMELDQAVDRGELVKLRAHVEGRCS